MQQESVILFACIEKNLGDDIFIKLVCERYKDVKFIISDAAKYGDLEKISNLYFDSNLKNWLTFANRETLNPILALYNNVKILYYQKKLKGHLCAVYIVGNAFKNQKYIGKQQSLWIKRRVELVEKFYLLSTNFGPYDDERWKQDMKIVFSKMTDICFRDSNSYQLFHSLSNVRYAPDAVLGLNVTPYCMQEENLIIISIIDCDFSARSEKLHQANECFQNNIIKIADYYAENNYKVVLFNANTVQDRPAADQILSKIKNKDKVSIYDYEGDIDNTIRLFSSAKYIIGVRLHTIILGLLLKKKVIPFVYDNKISGMLDSIMYYGPRFYISEKKKLSPETVDEFFSKYKFIIDRDIINQAEQQFAELDKYLDRR